MPFSSYNLTPREVGVAQDRMLTAIKAATGATDEEIASAAGVDRTIVSRWRSLDREQQRPMKVCELMGLVRTYGADLVLGVIADRDGCEVVRREGSKVSRDAVGLCVQTVSRASAVLATVHEAAADGRFDPDEVEAIDAAVESAIRNLRDIASAVRAGGAR